MHKSTTPASVVLVAAVLLAAFSLAPPAAGAFSAKEEDQIEILRSDRKPGDKGLACKRLAIVGTDKAVPALAPLLADPELASWARIALEAIPGPAPDKALREAVSSLKGRLLVGVINSLAVRRDAKAVPILKSKLKDADAEAASAAAVALGRIDADQATKTLSPLLAEPRQDVRDAVAEGCILAAESKLAAGARNDAAAAYDTVRAADVSLQKKLEATRGAILARGAAGVPLLAELLRAEDKDPFRFGLRVARELPGPEVTAALMAQTERATPARQACLLLAMADRGDKETLPIALKAGGGGDPAMRIQAFKVLGRLGNPAAAGVLLAAALDENAAVKKAAEEALRFLSGPAINAAVTAMLKHPEPQQRLLAVSQLAERQLPDAADTLMAAVGDKDEKVRVTAIKALGNLAGIDELPDVLGILLAGKSPAEIRAAEKAVSSICMRSAREIPGKIVVRKAVYGDLPKGRQKDVTKKVAALVKRGGLDIAASNGNFGDPAGGTVKKLEIVYTVNGATRTQTVTENGTITLAAREIPAACLDAILDAQAKAPAAPKLALVRVLRDAGGARALAAVSAATRDKDAEVRETASRVLCQWPDPAALPHLETMARESDNNTLRILALRGCIRLFDQDSVPSDQRVDGLKNAASLAARPEEKRLVLAALGNIPSPKALALVTPYLTNDQVREEACAAALKIVEAMKPPRSSDARQAARAIAEATKSARTAKRALELAQGR